MIEATDRTIQIKMVLQRSVREPRLVSFLVEYEARNSVPSSASTVIA
jgi:hypothetical protein